MSMEELEHISRVREEAHGLRVGGNPLKAVALVQKARKKWPKNANLLTDLASCYASVPDFERAEKCLGRLLERFPESEEVLLFAAELRGAMRRLNGSFELYERVVKRHPKSARAWLKLAEIHERQSRLEEARECLARALQLEPEAEMGCFREAVLLTREKRLEEAAQGLCDLLQKGLKDREVHWKAGHQLAMVLDKMGIFPGRRRCGRLRKRGWR